MAIVQLAQPAKYNLAYNDNCHVFYESDPLSSSKRFIVTVYDFPSLEVLSTHTVFPSVDSSGSQNKAYFDPSRILQTRLSSCIQIPAANYAGLFPCNSISIDYKLRIQSQDLDANDAYQTVNTLWTGQKRVWNGGVNKIDWLSFDYEDFDVDLGSGKRLLTNAPKTQYIGSSESAFLHVLGSVNFNVKTISITAFYPLGGAATTELDYTAAEDFVYVPVGTYDIANVDPTFWTQDPALVLSGAEYYTVTIGNSETFTYRINERCSKYDTIRLHWLNRLGGFDSFNFNLKSMEETDIDRRSYQQNPHTFTGSAYSYSTSSRGVTDYHVGTQRKLTVNTPFLTEDESTWMEDFATSPVIFQEVNNQLIAMSGMAKTINKQTSLNDKLMQYTFELNYSLNDMRQRG